MQRDEALTRLAALGFEPADAETLWEHFDDAERRGKLGHGHSRIPWLEKQGGFDPSARPLVVAEEEGYVRYDANGTIGYLGLRAAIDAARPRRACVVVVENCFPTGMLGHYARRAADARLVSVLTATSPRRLGHPAGGPKLASTSPLAIGVPSSDGRHIVADVSMSAVTWGDVIAGRASEDELVPFGGAQAYKAFALALGLQLLVDALVAGDGFGAVALLARPEADPVPALRELARGVRLPGDAQHPSAE